MKEPGSEAMNVFGTKTQSPALMEHALNLTQIKREGRKIGKKTNSKGACFLYELITCMENINAILATKTITYIAQLSLIKLGELDLRFGPSLYQANQTQVICCSPHLN